MIQTRNILVTASLKKSLIHWPRLKVLKWQGELHLFHLKEKEDDIRKIGDKLDVSMVLEGSVRKSENRVRITAQLINTADGYHIWSEQYDRELKDIFCNPGRDRLKNCEHAQTYSAYSKRRTKQPTKKPGSL